METHTIKEYDFIAGLNNDLLIAITNDEFFDQEDDGEVMTAFDDAKNALTITMLSGRQVVIENMPDDVFKLLSNSYDFILAHTNSKDQVKPWLCVVENSMGCTLH